MASVLFVIHCDVSGNSYGIYNITAKQASVIASLAAIIPAASSIMA